MTTAVEFMHPVLKSKRADQGIAALLYLEVHSGQRHASLQDVRDVFKSARVKKWRDINLSDVLAKAAPNVARENNGWTLTATGRKYVRSILPDIDSPAVALQKVPELSRLIASLKDANARSFVEEGLTCLEAGALRAAIVFVWTGAVSLIREEMWRHPIKDIEAALVKHNPKAKFKKKGDFDYIKDKDLLLATGELGIFDKTERQRLGEALDLRNGCGHPTSYKVGRAKVAGYLEDIIGIVFKKLGK